MRFRDPLLLASQERPQGVAIRANEIASSELLLEEPGAAISRKAREVGDLLRAGSVVECHRGRMEASTAVETRP